VRSGSSYIFHGSRRLGDIVSLDSNKQAPAERDLGRYITNATVAKQKSQAACVKNQSFGWTGNVLWVKNGCRADFDVTFGASSAFPDYAGADRNLQQMIARITSCQIGRNTAVPSSWILQAPTGTVPADVKAAWDSYSLRLNSELPAARDTAGVFCGAGTNNGGVSSGTPSASAPSGYSAISGEAVDLYGGTSDQIDIYTPAAGSYRTPAEGGTDVVANPFAPQPAAVVAPPVNHTKKAVGFAAGGLALVAVAVFALKGRSKRSRKRSR
jgi:hypothetical protein